MTAAPTITWVIKFSKFCNLRCSYCYEFESLADVTRIPLSALPRLFASIASLSNRLRLRTKICWHGGEPLLLDDEYFEAAFAACDREFARFSGKVIHIIQTNLVQRLSDEALTRLSNRFDVVGVSIDPFSDERKRLGGQQTNSAVLANMDRLRSRGIRFGCISVLHKNNIAHIDATFRFFNEIGTGFRVLPFYRSASSIQADSYGLSEAEITAALKYLFDLWLEEGRGISIQPLDNYIFVAAAALSDRQFTRYAKRTRERVLIVDTDGSVYAVADTYDPNMCYGNVFVNDLDELLTSLGRARAIADAERRMVEMCDGCEVRQHCSGWYAAEATVIERVRRSFDARHCPVAFSVIMHIMSKISSVANFQHFRDRLETCETTSAGVEL